MRNKIRHYTDQLILLCGPARKETLSERDDREPPPFELEKPTAKGPALRGILVPPRGGSLLEGENGYLALLTLSCFRRTRSLVALRSVLAPLMAAGPEQRREDLGPANAVDALLGWYCQQQYLTSIEGGMYWMRWPLRDAIYAANSQFTDTATICQVFSPDGLKQPDKTLAQLVLLALHHDRIARQYYFETFIQSKDPPAFFEYLYHRVSSIRYLTKLDLLLEPFDPGDSVIQDVCELLRKTVYAAADSYVENDPSSRSRLTKPAKLHREIQIRRAREIASLHIGWTSAVEVIAAQVPAEQLISWCRWLIEDDLPRFCTAYYLQRAREEGQHVADTLGWTERCKQLDRPVFTARSRLRDAFFSLWVTCCRERGDDRAMRQVCGARLLYLLKELEEWLDSSRASPDLGQALQECKAALKSLASAAESKLEPRRGLLLKLFRGLLTSAPATADGKNAWKALLRRLYEAGNRTWPKRLLLGLLDLAESQLSTATDAAGWLEALERAVPRRRERNVYVRLLLLQAEYHWRHISFHGRRLPASPPCANDQECIKNLRRHTENGFIAIRRNDLPEQQAREQFSYFHYRTRLLLYRARSSWLSALTRPAGVEQEELFKQAHRDFELARGRLDSGASPTFLAQIDLAAAESVLAQAGADPEPPFLRVGARLDITDGYLRQSLQYLLRGRRNLIWWREYYRLRAQYKAERNLWRLRDVLETIPAGQPRGQAEAMAFWDRMGGVLRQFIRSLRHGFLAIGYGRDLEQGSGPASLRAPWLTTTYWELVFTALWMGGVILRWCYLTGKAPHPASAREMKQLQEYILDLATRNGAPWPGKEPAQLQKVRKAVPDQLREGGLLVPPRRQILELAAETVGRSPRK